MSSSVTLVILAGGAGARMGMPKAWLTLRGRPILSYLMERLRWDGATLLVTSPTREHPPGRECFDAEVTDAFADQGPLRGLVTALEHTSSDILVAITCDMPAIKREQLRWLATELESQPEKLAIMLGRRDGADDRIEPFPCAIRRSALDLLRQRLGSSDRSIHSLADLPQFALIAAPADWPAETWTNLNRPADLVAFDRSFDARRTSTGTDLLVNGK